MLLRPPQLPRCMLLPLHGFYKEKCLLGKNERKQNVHDIVLKSFCNFNIFCKHTQKP